MVATTDWAQLIPHAGAMRLLDAVQAWDGEHIHATASSHADAANPLRGHGGLHAVNLVEYAAQAMAAHGTLLERVAGCQRVRPGRLVSLREVGMADEYVDGLHGRLDVHAQRIHGDDHSAQYSFRVEHCGRVLISGRAAVIHPDA